ncbi:hypothetical protein TMatcc_006850 [Talaromyces marneffei ATCC 18224]|uniref:Leucine rich repeat protein n=1 Tax=Talaromyces marneffei (strain ATCC 18224 / CBS 334.59 / QM 7333) TaxID=441960 RepID=B6QDJ1_TALMQ|nr:conserved hypothetical protein [Talaromyces marneffei ATCC 18224]KAE8553699.1 hypothetical protein EYB25_005081 [Talaromyces marneffei]
MARLNYTARKISGVKAGLAVKKDLAKRIPTTPTFKVREPVLEIDISGKELTDDGFNEFILDLRVALQSASPEYPQGVNKLQELHLKGNRLTINALVELAKIINLSSRDLKELDISNNEISIVTVSDAQKWKYFLQSFGQCCVMKKIDFSGNALGTRGIEILARAYIRSELDFVEVVELEEEEEEDGDVPEDLMREHSSRRDHETAVTDQGTKTASRRGLPQASATKHHILTDAELRRYACTRGLRSVPYLILQDVGMTNGAIVHLAEMLRLHRAPENLLSFLPGGKPPVLPPTERGPCGIYWLPNSGLSILSLRLMQLTEEIKESAAEADSEDELIEDFDGLDIDLDYEEIERAHEEQERRRRHRQKLTVNLGRTISQQRIHVLATEGLLQSVLWHCALRMLAVARTILLDYLNRPRPVEDELIAARKARQAAMPTTLVARARSPFGRPYHTGAILGAQTEYQMLKPRERVGSPPRRTFDPVESGLSVPTSVPPIVMPESLAHRQHRNPTPRGALISSFRFNPQSSTFDVMFPAMHHPSENTLMQTNPPPVASAMPNYPRGVQKDLDFEHISKNGAKSVGNGNNHPASTSPPGRNGKKPAAAEATTDNYRSKYQFGLPLHLWQRIITESMGVYNILHLDQRTKIINYAASWSALEAEMSINGAAEHQQIWKILDCIDCFTYKPLS